MTVNEGSIDRVLRVFFGAAAIAASLVAFRPISGDLVGILLLVVGLVLLLTGLVGFCPAYKLVGLSTCPLRK